MVVSMDRWVDKVAIVTGASSGIGAAIAERLVNEGMKVAALARRKERLEELAKSLEGKKGKLYPIVADVSKEEDILNAFKYVKEHLGPVHVLINNAGIMKQNNISNGRTEDWLEILKINVLALNVTTREAVNDMMANNVNGHIIHMNSIAGRPGYSEANINMYAASKHAVTALTETHRAEFIELKTKIKVTSINPGLVDTEILDFVPSDVLERVRSNDVILNVEDIADSVIYVLSTPPHVQIHELTIKPVGEKY